MNRTRPALVLAAALALGVAVTSDATPTIAPVAMAGARTPAAADPVSATELDPTDVVLSGAAADGAADATPRRTGPARPDHTAAAPATTSPWRSPTSGSRALRGAGDLLTASGTSEDPIDRGGRTITFSVEVEAETGLDPDQVAALAEEALYDTRSWARDFQLLRVAPRQARVRIVIALPSTVDTLCSRAGLRTASWLSCWTGSVAAINLDRWNHGVPHVPDLAQYRRYVINHEVGHGLGYDHRDCTGDGHLAHVMQQQTKTLSGCLPNEWRHP